MLAPPEAKVGWYLDDGMKGQVGAEREPAGIHMEVEWIAEAPDFIAAVDELSGVDIGAIAIHQYDDCPDPAKLHVARLHP